MANTRRSAILLAGSLALQHVGAAAGDGFVLQRFNADSEAKCLDGTPGGYYVRNGTASSWMIEMEGGGWCYTAEDCLARSKTAIGSSNTWPETGCPSMDGGSNGMFSNNCTISRFCNWTAVHMNYCDGASFAGYRGEPLPVNGTNLYFRGRTIMDATIDSLLARGLASAKEVILKGCSAGGLAVLLHLDYFAARVKAVNPGIRVVGMPDAGLFLDHGTVGGGPSVYTPQIQSTVELHRPLQPGSVNDGCLAAHNGTSDAWKCFMGPYTLPHITTPYYMTQDLDDTWQMQNIFMLPCQPWVKGSCNATELAWMNQYRADMLQVLAPLLGSSTNGAFLSTCVQHCHQNNDPCWTAGKVQNQTLDDSFWSWYSGAGNLRRIVVDGNYGDNPTCYCTPYQCARGASSQFVWGEV